MKFRPIEMACLLGLVAFSGCGGQGKDDASKKRLAAMSGGSLKTVVPVKGSVKVDGIAMEKVRLFLYREETPLNSILEAETDADGKYCWTTHTGCDGLEPGKYLLGFTYVPKQKKNGEGEDLLKGNYKNPQKNKSDHKIELTVEQGAPQENTTYELVTK